MKGTITKKDWREVAKIFGWKKAIRLLLSRRKTALLILVG